jgi:hypothetical protein
LPEAYLLFFPVVGDEVEFGAGLSFEFGRAPCAGEVVANAEGVAFNFVDAGESSACVGSNDPINRHAFWFCGNVNGPGSVVGFSRDGCLIIVLVEFKDNGLEEFVGHRFAAEFGFNGEPGALKGFDIGGVVGGQSGQRGESSEANDKEIFHWVLLLGCPGETFSNHSCRFRSRTIE